MVGNLKKQVADQSFIQFKSFYKRFYTLDFPRALLVIKYSNQHSENHEKSKSIPFSSIKGCKIVIISQNEDIEEISDPEQLQFDTEYRTLNIGNSKFKWPFLIQLVSRSIILCAQS